MAKTVALAFALAALLTSGAARAQGAIPYGPAITLAQARKAAVAAEAAVAKVGSLPDVIAIVEPGGNLVYLERMDNAQLGSVAVAISKARSAALFRRPSKVFQDALAKGRTAILGLAGAVPLDGGLPLVIDGKLVGAIGVSGGTGEQDGKVAKAGAEALQ